jgi:small subunit ribosomal protein S20
MPHTASAKKRMRQSEKRRARNRAANREIRNQLKQVQAASESGNLEQLRTEAVLAIKKLDKAGARRIVHPNQVARKKSQIARLVRAKEQGSDAK